MSLHYCFINRHDEIELNDKTIDVHNFFISPDKLDFYHLMDSCIASPARYIYEVIYRCYIRNIKSELVIFNPYYSLSKWQLSFVLQDMQRFLISEEQYIFSDRQNRPIAYFFPKINENSLKILFYLSACHSECDQRLLEKYIGSCHVIKWNVLQVYSLPATGFFVFSSCYLTSITMQAINNPEAVAGFKNRACMFYHAGDFLFLLEGLVRTSFSHFKAVATCAVYRDIGLTYMPESEITCVSLRPFNRGRNDELLDENEEQFLAELMASLSNSHINFNFRYFYRSYQQSNHHLIDQFAFGLGGETLTSDDLFSCQTGYIVNKQTDLSDSKHIFIHLDAGWPLKEYPKQYRIELLEKLRALNFSVTVLDDSQFVYPDEYRVIKFQGLEQLRNEILASDLMIGMDSFPVHYANIVLDWKTITLFGSTHPYHSSAQESKRVYQVYDSSRMKCCPCLQMYSCDRYRTTECSNFIKPDAVIKHVKAILNIDGDTSMLAMEDFPMNSFFKKNMGRRTLNIDLGTYAFNNMWFVLRCRQMYLNITYPFVRQGNTLLRWIYTKGLLFTLCHVVSKVLGLHSKKN